MHLAAGRTLCLRVAQYIQSMVHISVVNDVLNNDSGILRGGNHGGEERRERGLFITESKFRVLQFRVQVGRVFHSIFFLKYHLKSGCYKLYL